MKHLSIIIFFIGYSIWSQSDITATFIDKKPLKTDHLVFIDNFNTQYGIINNEFYLNKASGSMVYSNLQLGYITSADVFNPLKPHLLYRDLNSVVVLDNKLGEIAKVNFNELQPFRIVSHSTTANDNSIWIFNDATQQLELFDYLNQKSKLSSIPIQGTVLTLQSDYNNCWVLTTTYLYRFNYFGSLLSKQQNTGFNTIRISGKNLLLLKDNRLYFSSENTNIFKAIELPELLIKQFFVTNETLYIYDGEFLYRYQLKIN